jgi:uncharacterized Zn finger protein
MADDRDRPWWRDRYGESTRPKEARGGIKAHSRRGAFGQSWWARRWLDVLERLELGGRLTRGRAYARRGQVLDIKVEEGSVHASVQGSRDDPYAVTIRVHALSAADWAEGRADAAPGGAVRGQAARVGDAGGRRGGVQGDGGVSLPRPARRARHGVLVPGLGEPVQAHRGGVLPARRGVRPRSVPHLPAARALARRAGGAAPRAGVRAEAEEDAREVVPRATTRAPACGPGAFWGGGEVPAPPEVRAPEHAAALLRRLGPFSFWRGRTPMTAELDPLYESAAARALDVFVGGSR